MKTFLALTLFAVLGSGCIIGPRHHRGFHGAAAVRRVDCPPAHHWDGYACRHNGHGHGNGNGKR
ncbi:MAG: hypothetical protein Q8N23_31430 [Archangium sp.]|nr:hypothetical protein [Archangium sp.]